MNSCRGGTSPPKLGEPNWKKKFGGTKIRKNKKIWGKFVIFFFLGRTLGLGGARPPQAPRWLRPWIFGYLLWFSDTCDDLRIVSFNWFIRFFIYQNIRYSLCIVLRIHLMIRFKPDIFCDLCKERIHWMI
jgi:hypothetical protein